MNNLLRSRAVVLIVGAALALSAGCSTAPQPIPDGVSTREKQRTPLEATGGQLLYIAEYFAGDVKIYSLPRVQNVGAITGIEHPQGVAVDPTGNVYVVDQATNNIYVFRKGETRPFKTLIDRKGIAFQVAVGNDGTVYVSNEFNRHLGNGNILEYAHGSRTPTLVLTDPTFSTVEDVALDPNGNLYVTYDNAHVVGKVMEYAPGSTKGVQLRPTLRAAGGIAFDAAADLLLCDQTAPGVKIFAQGARMPKLVFAQGQIDPFDLALTKDHNNVFVTDPRSGNTYEYALPSGTLERTIVNQAGVSGIAI